MLGSLLQVIRRPLTMIGMTCMLILILFHTPTSTYYYLTLAQLLFIPMMVEQLVTLTRLQKILIACGQVAVTFLYFSDNMPAVWICVFIYLFSTMIIAWQGIKRFLNRGFVHTAEMMIDIGLIYLGMGGIWFLAFHLNVNTGFSPIINWLTAIHFHYSAFLLCISVGLLGRIHMTRIYRYCAAMIAAGPMLVAIGITFSKWIEIISVTLYVVAIFTICFYSLKWKLPRGPRLFLRVSFLTLCFTIIWSFLYALSNFTGSGFVDIPDMLTFHGLFNCLLFGLGTVIAWSLFIPPTQHVDYTFPVSQIRGKVSPLPQSVDGLVDDMGVFIDKTTIPPQMIEFYEQTTQFQLTASVYWATWFKPFAFVYQIISRRVGQLNLPYSSKPVVMDGEIRKVDERIDGRDNPRVWQRTIKGKPVFHAIYSKHTDDTQCYMNIALPLPFSTMHGILTLSTANERLYLTSDGFGDAGTYLVFGQYIMKLPLHEYFVMEAREDVLKATHKMTIFGMHFLQIDYDIRHR